MVVFIYYLRPAIHSPFRGPGGKKKGLPYYGNPFEYFEKTKNGIALRFLVKPPPIVI
jgi:hypothetical protein